MCKAGQTHMHAGHPRGTAGTAAARSVMEGACPPPELSALGLLQPSKSNPGERTEARAAWKSRSRSSFSGLGALRGADQGAASGSRLPSAHPGDGPSRGQRWPLVNVP